MPDRSRSPHSPSSTDPAEPLFSVAPSKFVEERNRLAAELRRAGKADEAAAVCEKGNDPICVEEAKKIR